MSVSNLNNIKQLHFILADENSIVYKSEVKEILKKYKELHNQLLCEECMSSKSMSMLLDSNFRRFYDQMVILEASELIEGNPLDKRLKAAGRLYSNWLLSSDFLNGHKYRFIRNLGVEPILERLTLSIEYDQTIIGDCSQFVYYESPLGKRKEERFCTPLTMLLGLLGGEERANNFHHFAPGSKETIKQIEAQGETVDERGLLGYLEGESQDKKIKIKERPSIQVNRDKDIIKDITGKSWEAFYEQDKLSACRILALLSHARRLNGGSLKPLFNHLGSEPSFDLIPMSFWDKPDYLKDDWLDDTANARQWAKKWLVNSNDRYALDIPTTLAELLGYVLDGCSELMHNHLAGLYSWYQSTVEHYVECCFAADNKTNRKKFRALVPSLLHLEIINLHLPLTKESSTGLYERFALGLLTRMIKQYEMMHLEVRTKAISKKIVKLTNNHSLAIKLKEANNGKVKFKSISFNDITRNPSELFVFRIAALSHLLISFGTIKTEDAIKTSYLKWIISTVNSELEDPTKIPFKRPKKSAKAGPANVMSSLTAYGKTVFFAVNSKSTKDELAHLPRAHAYYWRERFKHIKRSDDSLIEPGEYNRIREFISTEVQSLLQPR